MQRWQPSVRGDTVFFAYGWTAWSEWEENPHPITIKSVAKIWVRNWDCFPTVPLQEFFLPWRNTGKRRESSLLKCNREKSRNRESEWQKFSLSSSTCRSFSIPASSPTISSPAHWQWPFVPAELPKWVLLHSVPTVFFKKEKFPPFLPQIIP